MSSAETRQEPEPGPDSNLLLWLVSSVANVSLAETDLDVTEAIRRALEEIGVSPVKVDTDRFEGIEGEPGRTLTIGSGPSQMHASLGRRLDDIDPPVREALDLFIASIEPAITRFSASDVATCGRRPDRESSHALAGTAPDDSNLSDILASVVESLHPTSAAIVSNRLQALLASHDSGRLGDLTGGAVTFEQVAARILDELATSEDARPLLEVETDGVLSYAIRLTTTDVNPVAVVFSFAGEIPERSAIDQFAATLRTRQNAHATGAAGSISNRSLTALNEATLAAASTHDLEQLYEAVRAALSKVLPTDAMLIATIPQGSDEAVSVYRSEGDTAFYNRAPLSQPFQTAMKLGRPFIVDEIPQHLHGDHYRFGNPGKSVQSLAGAPLVANNQVSGLIVAQSYDAHAFRVEHADLLLDIGRSIAVALERAQLLDRLRARSSRELALRNLTQALTSTLDVEDILDAVVSELHTVLNDTLVVAVGLDNSTGQPVRSIAYRGPDDLRESLGIHDDGDLEPSSWAGQTIGDYTRTSTLRDGLACATLPLHDEGECIGELIFARLDRLPFSDDEQSTFAIVEGVVVSALRKARQYRERTRDQEDLVEVERISRLVASSLDTEDILTEILSSLPRLFHSEGCSVRIVDGDDLVPLAVQGEIVHTFADRVPISTSLAGTVVRDKRLVSVDDLHTHPATGRHARRNGIKVRGWLAAPMIDAQGDVFGVLSIHSDFPRRWSDRDRVLLQTLAESTTVAIQNAWRFRRTRDVLLASVESLANAVDAKDPTTLNHSRNVSLYARKIAEKLELQPAEIENIALAGLLHDIGKIGIPDRILQKPDSLDSSEWEQMKSHPVIGEQILSGNTHLAPVLPIIRHHHERWDGMGYPDRLQGDAIPLGASIVAIADAVDTMASNRPYRMALPWPYVCQVIQTEAGSQFNPVAAEAFLSLVDSGDISPTSARKETQPGINVGARTHSHSLDARALMIFHGIAREVRALTDIETFIENVTLVIREVMGLSDIQVFLVDDGTGEIVYQPTNSDRLRGFQAVRRTIGTGVVGWVVEHGEPLLVPDVLQDERFIFTAVSEVRSELAVPLIVNDRVIGAINAESGRPSAFSDSDVRLLTATAAHLAQSVQVARLHNEFKQLASTDALTGLANHRAFYERLEEQIRHTEVTGSVLTVAIMDIDNLKVMNDTFGHLAGDDMLREIADVLKARCRRSDHVARYGGDEFAFILADTDLEGAGRAINHIVEGLRQRRIAVDGKELELPTGAWGMATYPEDGVRPSELVRVADQRMYTHKRIAKGSPLDQRVPILNTVNLA